MRRNAAHVGHRLRRQRCGKARIVIVCDEHKVGRLARQPPPQRVRLGVLAVGNAARRERQRGRIGVGNGDGEQTNGATAAVFVSGDRCADGSGAGVVAVQAADQNDGGGSLGRGFDDDGIDACAAAREADVKGFGGRQGHRDQGGEGGQQGDGECTGGHGEVLRKGRSLYTRPFDRCREAGFHNTE